MNLHAVLVAFNEADRYLDAVLSSLPTDSIHVFDDRSTDDTVEMARDHGAVVTVREEWEAGFLDDEGEFRQSAWEAFKKELQPKSGDWVLAIDCDEFLVAPGDSDLALAELTASDIALKVGVVNLLIHEVFEVRADGPCIRKDGYWGDISAPRLFRYRWGGRFADKKMGCGSAPTYTLGRSLDSPGLALAHYGYAERDDRRTKYDRYAGMTDHGHNPAHIQSILGTPRVEPLGMPAPVVWRGRRQSMVRP